MNPTDESLSHSRLVYYYLEKYQSEPNSRAFAPLAEAYRKLGLLERALEIARAGIEIHPQFFAGRVILARILFDLKKFREVILELAGIITEIPDNLSAQKLLAESYLMLSRKNEALFHYKMLLYFNPRDLETAKMVKELETSLLEENPSLLVKPAPVPERRVALQLVKNTPSSQERSLEELAVLKKRLEFLINLLARVERKRGQFEKRSGL